MIKVIKVTGDSLSPFFLPSDYVIIGKSNLLFGPYKIGDTVVFTHPIYGLLIKKVSAIEQEYNQIKVEGSDPSSVDSDKLGSIPLSNILGKVLLHIKNPSLRI